jgi:hypothetical protein
MQRQRLSFRHIGLFYEQVIAAPSMWCHMYKVTRRILLNFDGSCATDVCLEYRLGLLLLSFQRGNLWRGEKSSARASRAATSMFMTRFV